MSGLWPLEGPVGRCYPHGVRCTQFPMPVVVLFARLTHCMQSSHDVRRVHETAQKVAREAEKLYAAPRALSSLQVNGLLWVDTARVHAQVAGMESLAKIMCMEVLDLRRERDRAVASRTVTGHLRNLLGYCLSIFCILRRVPSTFNS